MKNLAALVTHLTQFIGRARFASVTYRTKAHTNVKGEILNGGELSRYTLILGFSYMNCLEESLLEMELIRPAEFARENGLDEPSTLRAYDELLLSMRASIDAHQRGEQNATYTKKGMYAPIFSGLNLNLNDNTFQLFGLVQSKVTLEPGVYKTVKSSAVTIAKNALCRTLKIGKFREFAIDADTMELAKLNGETLVFG